MIEHTPGPWEVRPGYGMLKAEIGPPGRAVAAVWVKQAGTRDEQKEPVAWPEGEANARLIAAAPDLLEALTTIVATLSEQDDEGLIEHAEPMQKARAAIAKAAKEQP